VAGVPRAWPLFREVAGVTAPKAMVVSVSPIATAVGVEVLRKGGNAVDAAVAVGFALAVVHPAAGNIGGGGFMVFRFASGEASAIDYRESAPGRATPDMYLDSAGRITDASVTGHLASGVPGAVAGMAEAHRRYGRLPLADLIAPAIRLAQDGFILDDDRAGGIAGDRRLEQFPGRPPNSGPAAGGRRSATGWSSPTWPAPFRRSRTAARAVSTPAPWPISSWRRWSAAAG
jgi:gamma-glutamyltranspeptidase/glutathione hydrolase